MEKKEYEFSYFEESQAEQFAFYRIPKVLFTDDYFKRLSCEAKVLYGLMLDRMCLSRKNGWIDDNGRVYIIFSIEEISDYMNCGRDKCIKILAELDCKKGIGLVERIRRGLGRPDIIYVKNFIRRTGDRIPHKNDTDEELDSEGFSADPDDEDYVDAESGISAVQTASMPLTCFSAADYEQHSMEIPGDFQKSEKATSRSRKNRLQEVGKIDFKKSEKSTSGDRKNRLQEVGKSDPNNTYLNDTYKNNTDSINPSLYSVEEYKDTRTRKAEGKIEGGMEQIKSLTNRIKANIDYESLVGEVRPDDKKCIDEIVSVMIDAIGVQRDTVSVAGTDYPYQYVVNRLLQVDFFAVQDVIDSISKNSRRIKNIKAYILACVFNAPVTSDSYYRNRVSVAAGSGG